jgi:hypothetical protein
MLRPLEPHEYRCDACGWIFDKGWSDEEAAAEARKLHPGGHGNPNIMDAPAEERGVVCDDCFRMLMTNMGRADEIEA